MTTVLDSTSIEGISANFAGTLLRPGDEGYKEARSVHNGMIDKRPALIARCLGVSDIVAAVNFARTSGLEIAIRGGGHNVAGKAVCDGGVMIDLSAMKGIFVDVQRRTARAQGGVTWGEFDRETQLHGLATTGGTASTTGIAGLTLGGGIGWLMAKHGLVLDNLLSVELVTAAGDVLTASAKEHADLFWALRGGGGNFGVAASFEYQLHPVGPTVVSGLVAHPIEKAVEVLRFFRDATRSLPDDLFLMGGVLHAPDGSGMPIAVIAACHCGDPAAAEKAVKPLKEFGPPIMDTLVPQSYVATNMMFDAGFPRGALNYWKSSFLSDLSDAAIEVLAEQFSRVPSTMSGLMLEHFHGAATRVGGTATAFPHRKEGYNLLVFSEWTDPAENDRNIAWAREAYDAMQPHTAPGRYVNYLDDDEAEGSVAAAYGQNYARLQSIKATYDPANLFHMNQNIKPA